LRCWDKSQAFYILDRPFVITQLLSDQRWRKNKKGGKNFLFLYWNKWRCEKGRSFIELPSRDVKKRTNFDLFLRVIGKYNNSKEINQFFISFLFKKPSFEIAYVSSFTHPPCLILSCYFEQKFCMTFVSVCAQTRRVSLVNQLKEKCYRKGSLQRILARK
jgi:hypothetical protein